MYSPRAHSHRTALCIQMYPLFPSFMPPPKGEYIHSREIPSRRLVLRLMLTDLSMPLGAKRSGVLQRPLEYGGLGAGTGVTDVWRLASGEALTRSKSVLRP
jgi:hypothetical protein